MAKFSWALFFGNLSQMGAIFLWIAWALCVIAGNVHTEVAKDDFVIGLFLAVLSSALKAQRGR